MHHFVTKMLTTVCQASSLWFEKDSHVTLFLNERKDFSVSYPSNADRPCQCFYVNPLLDIQIFFSLDTWSILFIQQYDCRL